MRSRIEPMQKITRSLRSHRELILNYFCAKTQLSSGVVEGLNNKAKLSAAQRVHVANDPRWVEH